MEMSLKSARSVISFISATETADRVGVYDKMQKNHLKPDAAALIRYLAITLFCTVFSAVYHYFSHGVHSPWMRFLPLLPLLLGVVPSGLTLAGILPPAPEAGGEGSVTRDIYLRELYPFGIAAVTAASALKGILEIAGTDSSYPDYLLCAGVLMLAAGALTRFIQRKNNSRKP